MKVTSHCSQGEAANDPECDGTDVTAKANVKVKLLMVWRSWFNIIADDIRFCNGSIGILCV